MRVIVNATGGTHGVSATARYVRSLVQWLPAVAPADQITAFEFRWRRRPFSAQIANGTSLRTVFWPIPPRVGEALFRSLPVFGVGGSLRSYDVAHLPDSLPIECRARCRVTTVHHGPPMQRPDLFPAPVVAGVGSWLAEADRRSTALIAVSEDMRQTMIDRFGISGDRITAVPLGVDPQFTPGPVSQNRNMPVPYLLYVGRINKAKNVAAACGAFRRLARTHPALRLVLIGWSDVTPATVDDWLGDAALRQRVDLLSPLPADSTELVDWYRGAQVFVFPSFTEGWTSPPLEAMACGTPVVTSNVSSLPETVGDAALQVDPLDHDALAHAIERLMTDTDLRTEMIQRGLERAAQFTWERTARETLRVYRRVAGEC